MPGITEAPCNRCSHPTKHDVLHELVHHDYPTSTQGEVIYDVSMVNTWSMLQCRGCEEICLHHHRYFSEHEPDDGTSRYYPPRIARQLPSWVDELPDDVASLMREIYAALHANSSRLAIMGSRTLIDIACNDKVGDVGSFAQKLKAMEVSGYLGKKHREVLEPALETGHATIHRGFSPSRGQVAQVMDIVEHTLQASYVLEEFAAELKNAVPQRQPPKSTQNQGKGNA